MANAIPIETGAQPAVRTRAIPLAAWAALLAFVVRIAIILVRKTYNLPESDAFALGFETGSIARALAGGHGFSSPFPGTTNPTAWIAPIYPLLCAAALKVTGGAVSAAAFIILTLNSVFSALTCFAIVGIARRTVGEKIGLWTAFAWALLPQFAKWPTEWVWDMSISALLIACAWWLTLLVDEAPTTRRWVLFGGVWGVLALTNPAPLTLLGVAAVWLVLRRRSPRFWRHALLSAAVCAALIAPWMLRNRVVLGQWVFVRDNFGFEFHLGNYHLSNGMGWRALHPVMNPVELERYRTMGELAYIQKNGHDAWQFVRKYPLEFLSLCVTRASAFWDGDCWYFSQDPFPWTVWEYAAMSLVALFGLLWASAKRVHGALLFWWIPLYPLPYYMTYPQPRYRHEVEPEMLLLVVFFVAAVGRGVWERVRASA